MKTELALIALLALSSTLIYFNQNPQENLNSQDPDYATYIKYKADFNKNTNQNDDSLRFAIFKNNLRFIENFNAKKDSKTILGLTQFTDMTNEEFKAQYSSQIMDAPKNMATSSFQRKNDLKSAPKELNWVTKGKVAPVQNQGFCGSCWAFSTANQLEGLHAIKTGNLQKFSEQQLTSCVPAPFSKGCRGGNPIFGFMYSSQAGIESEESYPYVQKLNPFTTKCKYNENEVVFKNSGVGIVPSNSPQDMQSQLIEQPLAVAIQADSEVFQNYVGGVIDSKACGTDLGHAVSLVGYNFEGDNNYWIVKNSWGAEWGQNGYVWIENVEGDGICGINMDVTYPTLK